MSIMFSTIAAWNTAVYNGVEPVDSVHVKMDGGPRTVNFENSVWEVSSCSEPKGGGVRTKLVCALKSGALKNASVGFTLEDGAWSRENYLLLPAAAYNGNRYHVNYKSYPPVLYGPEETGANLPVSITDVPHLAIGEGTSRIQLKAGDLSTPAVCVFYPAEKKGFILLFRCETTLGYNGLTFTESGDRKKAEIAVTAPAMRTKIYTMCTTSSPSPDKGRDFLQGDTVELEYETYIFDCESVTDLYSRFFSLRHSLETETSLKNTLPYSAVLHLFEEKLNRHNWRSGGYYSVGVGDSIYADFQSGWVGGGMNLYPLYRYGSPEARERVKTALWHLFGKVQAESGFFYGGFHNGRVFGDIFLNVDDTDLLLMRKNADMLYFLVKLADLIKGDDPALYECCEKGIKRACDAFVRFWNRWGQWGQFVNLKSESVYVGSTASAAAAAAALALASVHFNRRQYMETAKAAAVYYYKHFTRIGLTNGGPGEITQCPDSESAFALLEAFTVLYEYTGEERWLTMARDAAHQAASWCVSYDFHFPKGSEFQRLDMKTTGSVYANVQNKHSAPGICTLSGDSLLKLYRFTGDKTYLRLCVEIAHNAAQYFSREDRPIRAVSGEVMPAGFMCERVNMCDWEGPEMVGSVFFGSCWCELSAALAAAELPGVYTVPELGLAAAFDSVEVELLADRLVLHNPTGFSCKVTVLKEGAASRKNRLPLHFVSSLPVVELAPGERKEFLL